MDLLLCVLEKRIDDIWRIKFSQLGTYLPWKVHKQNLRAKIWKVFITTRVQKNFEIARDGWNADYVDPMTFLDMFLSTSDQNNSGYNNPAYDNAINAAKKELDPQKRFDLMHQAEDMLMNDMPIIPVYTYTKTIGVKDYVKGYRVSLLNNIYFKEAYIEGKK